ncbi:MAG: response regulator [bacterium]
MYAAVAESEWSSPRPNVTGQPINALILDDSKFDRHRIRRLSRETGMAIYLDEVATIAGLQDLLDEDQFDIILLDYRLNVGDGLEALEMVRKHPKNAHVPTIMVTGVADPDVAIRAMRLGCSDFLAKSQMTAETLRQAVASAIEKSGMAQGTERRKSEMAQALSHAILAQFREALQPELAGVVRNVRTLRTSLEYPDLDLPAELDKLEARCVSLWSALTKLGQDPKN